jgi:hypothetical protein
VGNWEVVLLAIREWSFFPTEKPSEPWFQLWFSAISGGGNVPARVQLRLDNDSGHIHYSREVPIDEINLSVFPELDRLEVLSNCPAPSPPKADSIGRRIHIRFRKEGIPTECEFGMFGRSDLTQDEFRPLFTLLLTLLGKDVLVVPDVRQVADFIAGSPGTTGN